MRSLFRWLGFKRGTHHRSRGAKDFYRPELERLEDRALPGHVIGDHIHPILQIEILDQLVAFPADLGLTPTRHYSPHTHETTGTLHTGEGPLSGIDPPGSSPRLTTLNDFFDVWRTTNPGTPQNNPNAFFSRTQLLDGVADATHAVFMTVNGLSNEQFENFSPHDRDSVRLSFRQVVNRAPIANPQTVSAVQGVGAAFTLSGDDGNPEGVIQTVRFRVQSLPANGTLRDSSGNSVAVGVNLPSQNLTYTSNGGFTGSDSFSFIVIDNGGTANGGQDTSTPADVTINVVAPEANRPPTANSQNVRVVPGTSTTIRLTGDDGDPLVNQGLSFRVQSLPGSGTLRDSAGNSVNVDATLPSSNLTYTPNAGFTGTDSFRFDVSDDSSGSTGGPLTSQPATVSVNVVRQADPAGFVYVDVNDNAMREEGEKGIAGVTVELCGVEDAGTTVHLAQSTGTNGSYRFDQLWPGVYDVMEVQPAGYLDGQEALGTLGGTVDNDRFSNIVLGPGDVGEGYNFGELPN